MAGFTAEQIDASNAQPQGLTAEQIDTTNASAKGFTAEQVDATNKKVTFDKTPHNYDQNINDAATAHRIDPNLLRGVGMQETNLGTSSATYDAKTGLSRTKGNEGHGIFQLDPASGASKADLDRAANDPKFASDYAAKMLQHNLETYHNLHDALVAYNAGHLGSPQGEKYADQVLARMAKLDPIKLTNNLPPARLPHPTLAGMGADAISKITAPGDAVYKGVNNASVGFQQMMDSARTNPGGAVTSVLSGAQRPTTAIVADLINGKWASPKAIDASLGHAWQSIWHPEMNDKIVNSFEEAMVHDLGFPGWRASELHGVGKFFADMVAETISDPLTYVPGVDIFTVTSKVARTLAMSAHAWQGTKIALKEMGKFGEVPKVKAMVELVDQYYKDSSRLFNTAKDRVSSLGKRRIELDHFDFTPMGKSARMATENVASSGATHRAIEDAKILRDNETILKNTKYGETLPKEVQRHLLMEAYKHGDLNARGEAAVLMAKLGTPLTDAEKAIKPTGYINYGGSLQENFLSKIMPKGPKGESYFHGDEGTQKAYEFMKGKGNKIGMTFAGPHTKEIPEELAGLSMYDLIKHRMNLGNETIRKQQIAHKSAELYQTYGGKFMGTAPSGAESLPEWFAKYVPDRAGKYRIGNITKGESTKRLPDSKILAQISDLFKVGILGNPIPHAVMNVGAVTWMRSDPVTWARGLLYGLKGTPEKLYNRIESYGGMTTYWRDPSTVKTLFPKLLEFNQGIMERFERGFRASYLQHLDRTMGVLDKSDPMRVLHELNKGAKVDIDIGPYSHPTQLVQFFKGLGGLFDAFRLDAVPRAALAGIVGKSGWNANNKIIPILGKWRPSPGMGITMTSLGRAQENFDKQFMPQGAHLDLFGPFNDFARGTMDTAGYLTSTATAGPILGGVVDTIKKQVQHQPQAVSENYEWFANYLVPAMGSLLRARPSDQEAKKAGIPKEVRTLMQKFKLEDERNPAPFWVKSVFQAILGGYTRNDTNPRTQRKIDKGFDRARDK